MRLRPLRRVLAVLPSALLAACAGAPPATDAPKPATTVVAVAPPEEPTTTVTKSAPPPPMAIGSAFEVDPVEPLPPGAVARCGTARMRAALPKDVAVSNAGTLWVVDVVSNKWLLRDMNRGVDVATLPNGSGALFTPDASIVIIESAGPSGLFAFFSVPDGKRLGDVQVPLPVKKSKMKGFQALFTERAYVKRTMVSPDGTAIVALSSDGTAHLIDIASRKLVKSTKLPAKSHFAGISRGGARAVLETMEHADDDFDSFMTLRGVSLEGYSVMDLRTGATVRKATFKKPPRDPADPDFVPEAEHAHASFRISADGKRVFRLDGYVLTAVDVATGKESPVGEPPEPPGPGSLGQTFGAFVMDRTFQILDDERAILDDDVFSLVDGTVVSSLPQGFEAVSADGKHVATRNGRVFDLEPDVTDLRPGHQDSVSGLAFLPDNRLVAVGGSGIVWATDRCTLAGGVHFTADRVVTASGRSIAFFAGAAPGLMDDGYRTTGVRTKGTLRLGAFPADGKTLYLVTGGRYDDKGKIVVEDLPELGDDPKPSQEREMALRLESMAVSADGTSLAVSAIPPGVGTGKPSLKLLATAGLSTTAEAFVERAGEVAFAGSDRVLHAPERQGISVRKVPGLDEVSQLHHLRCCSTIAVSSDGKLVAGAEGKGFSVWEIASRRLVGEVPRAHREDVISLAFSPDGHHLATGSDDTTILLWDVRKLGVRPLPAAAETRITGAAEARLFIDTRSRDYRIQADGTLAPAKGHEKQKAPPLKSVTRLASADFAHCALAEGKVRCWGTTTGGILGIPPQRGTPKWTFAEHPTPTTVPVKDPVDLRASGSYACALERGGDLVCWGRLDYAAPVSAPGKVLGGVKSFDIGNGKACATGTDSVVRCWTGAASPTPVTLTDTVQIAGAAQHTCALDKAGAVQCAGQNSHDQLGDDTGLDRPTFAPVQGVSGAVAIVASHLVTCALVTGGGVVCWGEIGTTALARPTRLTALDGATALRIDEDSVCGLIADRIDCVDLKIRE